MESYQRPKWTRLKRDLLRHYDAERVYQKYKPVDVERYAAKKRQQPCHSLTQWRKYYVKYNSIAGGPLTKGYLSREDYNAYFLIGVQVPLRMILENRILQSNIYRHDEAQYTVREINDAAKWYFRRNRYETLMVRAIDLGEDQGDDDSGGDSDSDASGSEDDESDYDEFLRKKRLRAKRKKQEHTKKVAVKKTGVDKTTQKFQGNEEEIAGMIRKLNTMHLDDPEYAPIYYKVMVMDQSGTAGKCVKAPIVGRAEPMLQPSRPPPMRPPPEARAPTSYPNNIPLGAGNGGNINSSSDPGCFGCNDPGHRISECRRVAELLANGTVIRGEDGRRLVMKSGAWIRKNTGESLVSAAERMAASSVPRAVNYLDSYQDSRIPVSNFYRFEERRAQIVEVGSEGETESSGNDEEVQGYLDDARDRRAAVSHFYQTEKARNTGTRFDGRDSDTEEEGSDSTLESLERVYLTMPRRVIVDDEPGVNAADRAEPSIRKARKSVFDGVYPPRHEKSQMGEVKDLEEVVKDAAAEKRKLAGEKENTEPAQPDARQTINDAEKSRARAAPRADRAVPTPERTLPEIRPFEARRVRISDNDVEMEEGRSGERKKSANRKSSDRNKEESIRPDEEEKIPKTSGGRQSELTGTVDRRAVVDRIMDVQIPMSLREIFVTSKEIRGEIQDLIKVKNVRAVLLGSTDHHPLIANMNWPRTEGILIKIDMTTNGKQVCAIIDTGSQLDVVRADIAALYIGRSVDMSQVIDMKDANGGRGQLQGRISGVEFNCGGARTTANLWVSQKAPFELLLGRPWQRGNLVSIDERKEGTYLIFKDPETRQPRYELLAVPYDGPLADFRSGGESQYQSFALIHNESEVISREKRKWRETGTCFTEKGKSQDEETRCRGPLMKRITAEATYATHPASVAELAAASLNLGRVFLEVWAFLAVVVLSRAAARLLMSLNSISDQITSPLWRRDGGRTFPEAFQYLSRQRYSDPPIPVVSISPVGPVETVADAVARQWQKVADNQLIDIDPTFSAAPQSEYYGSVVLPDGQVLHRSSAQNVFRVFRDRKSGLPYTISCREFTFHLAAPRDPQRAWQLELVYPNDTRIRNVMTTMTPLQPPGGEDLGFPVHATQQVPPMVSMVERLRLPVNPSGRADTDTAPLLAAPPSIMNPNAKMAVDIRRPPSEAVAVEGDVFRSATQLGPSIKQQVLPVRSEATDRQDMQASPVTPNGSRSDPESLPDLESWSDADSADMGVCGLCFEAQHQSTMDCPLFGTKTRTSVDASSNVLEDLRGAEEPFSMEMRRVLDVALGPTLKERLSMPLSAALSYQALATTARKARKAFEFYTHDTQLRMEGLREKNLRRKDESVDDELETQRAKEVDEIIARMQREADGVAQKLAAEMDGHLEAHNVSTREQLKMEEGRLRSAEGPNVGSFSPSTRDPHSSYLATLSPPALNPRHGGVITRDSWSSSDSGSSDSGSYEEVHIPHYSTLSKQFALHPIETWSPVSTEWSVEDFLPNPTWVIDDAIARLRLRSPERIDSASDYPTSSYPTSTDSDYLTSYALSPDPQRSHVAATPVNPSETEASAALQENLFHWIHDGNQHMEESIQVEDEWITDPAQRALDLLSGALASFVDNTAAVVDGVQGLLMLAASSGPGNSTNKSSVADAPSSIDPTLLTLTTSSQQGVAPPNAVLANPATGANATEIAPSARMRNIPMYPMHFAPQKRKGPEGEENGFDQVGKRKKFPTGLTDTKVIELFAGVRLGIKETIRRVEEMVWTCFEITQQSFPSKFARHPLLFDLEAAQLQTLVHVLQFHGRLRPAVVLEEVLAIRLRDEYAVAHLLNTGYLEDNYPEESSRYWDLLELWPRQVSPRDFHLLAKRYPDGIYNSGGFDSPAEESAGDNASDSDFSVDMELSLTYPSILDERAPTDVDEDSDGPAPTHDYPPLFDCRISAHVSDLLSRPVVIRSELAERLSIYVDASTQTDGVHRGDSGGHEDDDRIVLERRLVGPEAN
ncbi:hypothetical protein B0H16DRAFT_1742328 [Mycena metata]|uniref:CCHC-type domain-containing protein n=1 Tax=Mycena metata TaxID=1033252 RepID=A0AAD7MFH0_9AGAR|nr:hypothetical protein B0H16DRAFT_1742328 [Mycena metata]